MAPGEAADFGRLAEGLAPGESGRKRPAVEPRHQNGFGGVPTMHGLGRYYEIEAVCAGEPDPRTGYLVNIKDVDRAVRSTVVPTIEQTCHERPRVEPAAIMWPLFRRCEKALPARLASLRWRLTPTYSVEVSRDVPTRVILRQRFDLAAAHRLHVPEMSDEDNRATFGRCNNPSGHGHNYRLEPAVAVDPDAGDPFTVADLERLTAEAIIEPFDHTHLNKDTPEFAERGGLNPSVENIAKVFYGRLRSALQMERADVELVSMTVWETDRTCCTYAEKGA